MCMFGLTLLSKMGKNIQFCQSIYVFSRPGHLMQNIAIWHLGNEEGYLSPGTNWQNYLKKSCMTETIRNICSWLQN